VDIQSGKWTVKENPLGVKQTFNELDKKQISSFFRGIVCIKYQPSFLTIDDLYRFTLYVILFEKGFFKG